MRRARIDVSGGGGGAPRAAVMQFYGFSTLEPTEWPADANAALSAAAATGSAGDAAAPETDRQDRGDLLGLGTATLPPTLPSVAGAVPAPSLLSPRSVITVDSAQEQFDPEQYLTRFYGNVPLAELERGMQNLRAKVDARTESLRLLVRNNLDRFMKSKDTIDHIRPTNAQAEGGGGRGARGDGRDNGPKPHSPLCTVLRGPPRATVAG